MTLQVKISNGATTRFLTLIIFSTAVAPFVGADERNYVVIVWSIALCVILILRRNINPQLSLVLLFLAYCFVINLLHYESARWSSYAYTVVLSLAYVCFGSLPRLTVSSVNRLAATLRLLLVSYASIGVIQYLMLVTGIRPLNGIVYDGALRENLLSVEPAHAALTVCMIFLAHRRLVHVTYGRPFVRRHVGFSAAAMLIAVFFTGSSMGVLGVLVITVLMFPVVSVAAASVGALTLVLAHGIIHWVPLERLYKFIDALSSLNVHTLAVADNSGSIRIQPVLLYFRDLNLDKLSAWIGSGADSQSKFFYGQIIGAPAKWSSGFFPGTFVDYGLVGGALFFLFVMPRGIVKVSPGFIVFFAIFMTTHWFNSQVFWLYLMLAHTLVKAAPVSVAGQPARDDASDGRLGRVGVRLARLRRSNL